MAKLMRKIGSQALQIISRLNSGYWNTVFPELRKSTKDMAYFTSCIAFAACLLALAGCGSEAVVTHNAGKSPKTIPVSTSAAVVDSGNAFAIDLYAKLASDTKGNLFFSPISTYAALAMTYAGASGNTADQMAETLHLSISSDNFHTAFSALLQKLKNPANIMMGSDGGRIESLPPPFQLTMVNNLWGQKGLGFNPKFAESIRKDCGADFNEVDFGQASRATKSINDSIAKQTKGVIPNCLPEGLINSQTRLILTNAVYFKSKWEEEFAKRRTKNGPFRISADKSADVPMMHQLKQFKYMETDDLQMLELKYLSGDLSMLILLPRNPDGLEGVEKTLTAAKLSKWLMDMELTEVTVTLPRFKFACEFVLTDVLRSMGIREAFDSNKADFGGMTSKEKLHLSAAVHKATIAVDEEGTEASAATGLGTCIGVGSPVEKHRDFKADHPFAFLIRHNSTGAILFMGRLTHPNDN
jgi:serpin B